MKIIKFKIQYFLFKDYKIKKFNIFGSEEKGYLIEIYIQFFLNFL
jgi:hypothetical protein